MASNPYFGGEPGPDQAQWTRMQLGMTSPLWFPFLMAASAGAAWWTYANFSRWAVTPPWGGSLQRTPEPDRAPAPKVEPIAVPVARLPESAAALPPPPAVRAEAAPDDDDGLDAIDAAYAANLGPVPQPGSAGKGRRASASPQGASLKSAKPKAAASRKAKKKKR